VRMACRVFGCGRSTLQARLLATGGTVTFFWSPDSLYLVLQSAGKLKKIDVIDVSGGPPQTLCDEGYC
jgi:hypothetical protein